MSRCSRFPSSHRPRLPPPPREPRAKLLSVDADPSSVLAGESTEATVRVKSVRGRGELQSRSLLFRLGDPGSDVLASETIPQLQPNHSATVEVDVPIPPGAHGDTPLFACRAKVEDPEECARAKRKTPITVLAPAELEISPANHAFGTHATSTSSANRTFTATNTGDVPTGVLTSGLAGSNPTQFTKSADGCAGAPLGAGASCTLDVAFSPTSTGLLSAEVRVENGPGDTASASLTGTGANPATLAISPSPHDFGARVMGTTSPAQQFTVTNTGGVPSGTIATSIGGDDPDQFTKSSDLCHNQTLGPGGSCTLDVAFAPTSRGGLSASVQASATPGGAASAALSGVGQAPANLQLTPASHDFGNVLQGTNSHPKQFTLTNTGDQAASITSYNVSSVPTRFGIGNITCGFTLPGGDSCTIDVVFGTAASDTGAFTGTLNVTATVGGSQNASLSGTAVTTAASLTITPPNFQSDTGLGEGAQQSIPLTLRNTGAADTGPVTYGHNVVFGNVVASHVFEPPLGGIPGCGSVIRGGEECVVYLGLRALAGGAPDWEATLNASASPGGSVTGTWTGP